MPDRCAIPRWSWPKFEWGSYANLPKSAVESWRNMCTQLSDSMGPCPKPELEAETVYLLNPSAASILVPVDESEWVDLIDQDGNFHGRVRRPKMVTGVITKAE